MRPPPAGGKRASLPPRTGRLAGKTDVLTEKTGTAIGKIFAVPVFMCTVTQWREPAAEKRIQPPVMRIQSPANIGTPPRTPGHLPRCCGWLLYTPICTARKRRGRHPGRPDDRRNGAGWLLADVCRRLIPSGLLRRGWGGGCFFARRRRKRNSSGRSRWSCPVGCS